MVEVIEVGQVRSMGGGTVVSHLSQQCKNSGVPQVKINSCNNHRPRHKVWVTAGNNIGKHVIVCTWRRIGR